jgi:hypothetical protein
LIKSQQIPLFPIVINSPHKRPNFAIRVFWTNQKVLTLLFSKFHKWSLIHWYTRLFGEPTVDRANGRQRNQRATRGLSRRLVGAPDCPVCTGHCPVSQEDRCSNGQLSLIWKEIAHRTSYRTCPVVHGLSGAPPDRKQILPSKRISNGS